MDRCDSYLEHRIRLADRKGLLVGNRLSGVQEYALDLMMAWEAREKRDDFRDRFKLAVLAHDPPKWVRLMFPDWFRDEDRLDAPDASLEDTEGVWEFEETVSPKDAEAMLAEFLENPTGTLRAQDVWR